MYVITKEYKNYLLIDKFNLLEKSYGVIYAMVMPFTNEVKYIGQTTNGVKRLTNHFSASPLRNKSIKNSWIKSIMSKGIKPLVYIIDWAASQNELDAKEVLHINTLKNVFTLVNDKEGGNGKGKLYKTEKPKTYKNWKESPDYTKRKAKMKGTNDSIVVIDSNGVVYLSLMECAKALNSSTSNIRKYLNNPNSKIIKGVTLKVIGKYVGKTKKVVIDDAIVKNDTVAQQDYIDKCLAVKAKYPKEV